MTVMRASYLSEEVIKDKSKADMLLRAFWLWQMVRLWCELIARASARLSITQIEIITLSFSLLALFIHGLHSSKPKDVECPINFYHKKVSFVGRSKDFETLSYAYLVPSKSEDRNLRPGSSVPNDIFRERDGRLFLLTTTSSTVLFGAIHCIAWQFNFPKTMEQWTWRACTLAGIMLPFVMWIFAWIGNRTLIQLDERRDSAEENFATAYKHYRTEGKRAVAERSLPLPVLKDSFDDDEVECSYCCPVTLTVQNLTASPEHLPPRLRALSRSLHNLVQNLDAAHLAREKFLRHRIYYQCPGITIYLMTWILVIIIAFTSFRRAPRGIYKGTWASFWPTFQ